MHVRTLRLENIFNHRDSKLQLPERGVVVVTGPNGAGKSSLVEAVAVALWGKTLRGSPAWTSDGTSHAEVELVDGLHVARTQSGKGHPRLRWTLDGEGQDHVTTTKAQTDLASVIGSFDVWRRCSVFSSSDASHFTLATDAERKRLLETILELTRFDAALEACRRDRRKMESEVSRLTTEVSRGELTIRGLERRRDDAQSVLDQLGPADGGPARDEAQLKERIDMVEGFILDSTEEMKLSGKLAVAASNANATAAVEASSAQRRKDAVMVDVCPTCQQPISSDHRDRIAELCDAELCAAKARERETLSSFEDISSDIGEQEQELAVLQGELQSLRSELAELRSTGRQRARQVELVADQRAILDDCEDKLTRQLSLLNVSKEGRKAKATALAELLAAEKVLGLKGVRAQVLGRALAGVEVAANVWLARLGCDVQLRLRSSRTLRSGATTDAISLELDGAGGGYGYNGASGGERRRIDIAILLALGEVAAAAHSTEQGTMWLDEVFDCLDDEGGIDAAIAAVEELSKRRCVVVITHSSAISSRLPAAMKLRVQDGELHT